MTGLRRFVVRAAIALLLVAQGSAAPDVGVLRWPTSPTNGSTPVLDALRAGAVVFPDCIGSVTEVATAAALISGRHEFSCGVVDANGGRNLFSPTIRTMPATFAAAGYATAMIGKWHFVDNLPSRPEDLGFSHVAVHAGAGFGSTVDRWASRFENPWLRHTNGWKRAPGNAPAAVVTEALRWISSQSESGRPPFFLMLAPSVGTGGLAELDAALGKLLEALNPDTLVVGLAAKATDELRAPLFIHWPARIAAGKTVEAAVSVLDVFPTLAGLAEVPGVAGDGVDLSAAVLGQADFSQTRIIISHPGGWPAEDSPDRHRSTGFAVREDRWQLNGLELFDLGTDPTRERNVFNENPAVGTRLLMAYGKWWEQMRPALSAPVRVVVGDERQVTVRLTAADWWPSRQAPGAARGMARQADVRRCLQALANGTPPVPETAGHWKLRVARDGHYLVRLAKLPPEAADSDQATLGVLKAGGVHLRVGKREVKGMLGERMTAATLGVDLTAGEVDLEGWFAGQLEGDRILGAFFVSITRAGERKRPDFELELNSVPGQ